MAYRLIQHITYTNHIPLIWLLKLNSDEKQHITDNQNNSSHKRSITFTYFGPQVGTISNLNTTNSGSHSGPQTQYLTSFKTGIPKNNNDNDNSGTYGLTCATCHLNYVGQTGRILKQRYSEQTRYILYNNPQSAYANHNLQHAHEYGP